MQDMDPLTGGWQGPQGIRVGVWHNLCNKGCDCFKGRLVTEYVGGLGVIMWVGGWGDR